MSKAPVRVGQYAYDSSRKEVGRVAQVDDVKVRLIPLDPSEHPWVAWLSEVTPATVAQEQLAKLRVYNKHAERSRR